MPVQQHDVWEVSEDHFPRASPIEAQLGFLLRYAILAPSTRNTQPWAFSVRGNRVHLLADFRKAQPVADPDRRELYLSIGCALENLLVAAEHFGFGHGISYFPEPGVPGLVATVTFEPRGRPSEARAGATLAAILRRRNDDGVFRPAPVPEPLRLRLLACRTEPDLQILLTDDPAFRQWIDALTLEADRTEFADPAFRRELQYWIRQGVFGSAAGEGTTEARRDHPTRPRRAGGAAGPCHRGERSPAGAHLRDGRRSPPSRAVRPTLRAGMADGDGDGAERQSDEPDHAAAAAQGRGARAAARAGMDAAAPLPGGIRVGPRAAAHAPEAAGRRGGLTVQRPSQLPQATRLLSDLRWISARRPAPPSTPAARPPGPPESPSDP